MGVGSYLRPKAAHLAVSDPHKLLKYIMNVFVILLIFVSVVFLMCYFYGYQLVIQLYGEQYIGCEKVLLICLIGVSIVVLANPIIIYHEALKQTDVTFKAFLGGLVITLSVGITLVIFYGTIGAAIGLCLTYLTIFLISLAKMKRLSKNN